MRTRLVAFFRTPGSAQLQKKLAGKIELEVGVETGSGLQAFIQLAPISDLLSAITVIHNELQNYSHWAPRWLSVAMLNFPPSKSIALEIRRNPPFLFYPRNIVCYTFCYIFDFAQRALCLSA